MQAAVRPLAVVATSHFDPIWRRTVAAYRRRRAAIYRAALDRLGERTDLRYTFCQALLVREFLADHPVHGRRFARFAREGRVEMVGAPLTIPDLNLPTGEALVRNQMEGKEWVRRVLGQDVRIACWDDAFGVPSTMPQILRRCGFDAYRSSRMPRADGSGVTGVFLWRGTDGSVIPCVGGNGMSWGFGVSGNVDDPAPDRAGRVAFCRADLRATRVERGKAPLFLWMGEEHLPTREALEAFVEAARETGWRPNWTTTAAHFRALSRSGAFQRARVVDEDLSRIFTGCYAMRPRQKASFFALEGRLLAAENLLAARGKPVAPLMAAWEFLFMAQFHDSLGGCHIEENARWLARGVRRARAAVDRCLRGGELVTPSLHAQGIPFLLPSGLKRGSRPLPIQRFDDDRVARAAFGALEGGGVRPSPVRVRAVRSAGALVARSGLRLLLGHEPRLEAGGAAWKVPGLLRLREETGTMWTEDYPGREWNEKPGKASLERVERGEIFDRAVWRGMVRWPEVPWPGFTRLGWRRSLLLFHESPCAWLRLELDWWGNSTEIGWRLGTPGGGKVPRCRGAAPFGWVPRTAHEPNPRGYTSEVFPSPRWIHARFGGQGWLVLHRGTPSWRAVRGALENVLLRSPVKRWTPFFPVQPPPGCWENGRHVFDFLLLPRRRFDGAEAERFGLQFQSPPIAAAAPGRGVPSALLESIPPGLVASSLARGRSGWRVRVAEARGGAAVWRLPPGWRGEKRDFTGRRLSAACARLDFGRFEIADVLAAEGRP